MSTGLTEQSYIDYLNLMLGGDFVELEIKSSLGKIVTQSLEEMKEYISLQKLLTLPYANRIDLTPYRVRSISQVYRTMAQDSVSGTAGSTDAFLLAVGMVQGIPYDMTKYAQLLQLRQIKNTISQDLDYKFDPPWLYISQNPMQADSITIEYTPIVSSVEEITEDYWIGKLKKLCLANAKIILGRVRGKFQLANALYQNDASQMLQEGNNEKAEVMNFLQVNHGGMLLPI